MKNKLKKLNALLSFKTVWYVMILVCLYYLFIAADRYVTTLSLGVRSTSGNNLQTSGLISLLSSTSSTNEDIKYLQAYIGSIDMLKILDKKIKLRQLYQEQKIDLPFRIYDSSSLESFLKYYQSRVKIKVDDKTGLLIVDVEGFTPESSYLIAKTIMEESEKFINEISHKAARDQMAFAEKELNNFKERLQKVKADLIKFQNKYGVFDPLKQAEAKATLATQIESSIAQKEAELSTMLSYMNEKAPQIVGLKAEISALKKQLEKESAKISSSNASKKLNNLAAQYQDLMTEAEFAQNAYTTALQTYETTRIEAMRKIKQLVIVQSPTKPESAAYPNKLYNIATIFMILVLIIAIARLAKTIIEEHKY
ncbi:capsule biosynthesis protein [Campylobacter sp. CCS1377]|uniref:Capsule biosynthesis protein n=1 Tax=Campylobacter sp. CCS1377 TaxID=3158229 RepID=A0AAU7E723_9BACT